MTPFEKYFIFFISILGTIIAVSCDDYQHIFDELLDYHNKARENHNANKLVLDPELCNNAKVNGLRWLAYINTRKDYESNYFALDLDQAHNLNSFDVFSLWYSAGLNYDYTKERISEVTDPFTRIVWRDTTKMGVAVVKDRNLLAIVVTYSPPGNQVGQFMQNVYPPKNNSL